MKKAAKTKRPAPRRKPLPAKRGPTQSKADGPALDISGTTLAIEMEHEEALVAMMTPEDRAVYQDETTLEDVYDQIHGKYAAKLPFDTFAKEYRKLR
jgi:hypothetical protein